MSLYREHILDHWKNPRNFGILPNPDITIYEDNPLCGDEVTLYLTFSGDKLTKIQFTNKGCALSTASASMLTEYVQNMNLNNLASIDENTIIKLLGVEVGPGRIKCATLPLVALKSALRKMKL